MGQWTLDQVSGGVTPFDTAQLYGNNFSIKFGLAYKPATFDKFVEPPRLDWHEKFIMLEHHKQERWVFEKNMYEHNPCSATLLIWPRRYLEAFDAAAGGRPSIKGSAKLFSAKHEPVKASDLGKGTTAQQKADAVRHYLSKKGGRLEVMIHDIPSLNHPSIKDKVAEHKERLLLFNVGLVGGNLRWKGHQHVMVDAALPLTGWTRSAGNGWAIADLALPNGFKEVPAPPGVSNVRPPVFGQGECW